MEPADSPKCFLMSDDSGSGSDDDDLSVPLFETKSGTASSSQDDKVQ
jgi:hypothetical protein